MCKWRADEDGTTENVEEAVETQAEASSPPAAPVDDSAPIEDAAPTENEAAVDAAAAAKAESAPPAVPAVASSEPAAVKSVEETVSPPKDPASAERQVVKQASEQMAGVAVETEQVETVVVETGASSGERLLAEQASGHIEAAAMETDAAAEEGDEAGTGEEQPVAPVSGIESGCRLDRDVLLASLSQVKDYLARTDTEEQIQIDESYLGRLSELVHVLNADMQNLRAYCERSQGQMELIRSPIRDITDRIFKTIAVTTEEEDEKRKWTSLSDYPYIRYS